jgi:hypothetical protein
MASNSVILYKNFDASKLVCGEQTKNKAGGNRFTVCFTTGVSEEKKLREKILLYDGSKRGFFRPRVLKNI